MLKGLFARNKIPVKELSMCMQTGANLFKFAVNNKIDFLNKLKFSQIIKPKV